MHTNGCGRLQLLNLAALSAVLFCAGCALKPVAVTGEKQGNAGGTQSETAMSVNRFDGNAVVTVAYNDGTTQPQVTYTSTTRSTTAGASHMGWSYSTNFGSSWTYGGRITPPADWPILWGDPGITHSVRDQRYVYIANLAVPKAKMDNAPGGVINGAINNYIGGGCIARSTDGGKNFSLYQCMQTKETDATGDFYDGGNMASDKNGNIYAGWVNVDTNKVHIWRAAGESGTFQKLTNPFSDGSYSMASHPRLRINTDNNELFVMALNNTGELLIARWNGSSWGATWRTGLYAQAYPCVQTNGNTVGCGSGSNIVVRTGPQFSFDIGAFGKTNDHLRIMFTRKSNLNNRLFIAGAGCNLGDQQCQYIAEWGTGEGEKDKVTASFNPLMRSYRSVEMAQKGEPSLWMGSHTTYFPASGTVRHAMGGVGILKDSNNQNLYLYLPIFQISNCILCADLRGYWGDYDDLQPLGPIPERERSNVFARTFTNSQDGCDYRWQYTSSKVHVAFTGK
jgi:hypothetical protein